jgi:precorrin-3B synthase
MQSGDGLIVRLRPRCGAFSVGVMAAVADLAESFGNGHIDLTRRGNIQIRGVTADRLASLWAALSELGLLDASADAEAVRNVMVSPLAGLDPTEGGDARGLARALEQDLGANRDLWRLPGKFGFAVDGGGVLPLDGERADIWLKAVRNGDAANVAVGVDRPEGVDWLGLARPDAAGAIALRAARAFLDLASDARMRMRIRDLSEAAHSQLRSVLAPHLGRMTSPPVVHSIERRLGAVLVDGAVVAVGFAAPFGRIEAGALRALAAAARERDVGELRLSPWRTLYAPIAAAPAATALLGAAAACGFIVDAADPLLSIEACPGAPGCRSTTLDTRATARALAPLLARLGCRSCHISGCSKGCARSRTADLVLVGAGERFGVLRYATAQGQPHVFVSPERISELPNLLETV